MSVAGLERMTTRSAVSALSYRATQVGVYFTFDWILLYNYLQVNVSDW